MSLTSKRVAVIGNRIFSDYGLLESVLNEYIGPEDVLVSGGAMGADSMAQRWAKENGHSIIIHYPNYKVHGKGAPFVRNATIINTADLVLAFYAPENLGKGGTAHSVQLAKEKGKMVMEFCEQ